MRVNSECDGNEDTTNNPLYLEVPETNDPTNNNNDSTSTDKSRRLSLTDAIESQSQLIASDESGQVPAALTTAKCKGMTPCKDSSTPTNIFQSTSILLGNDEKLLLNRVISSATRISKSNSKMYNWRMYAPGPNATWIQFVRWFVVGGATYSPPQTHDQYVNDLESLVQCLTLLRIYLQKYGMPKGGCVTDQDYVLREITCDLYSGGTPLWALESIMQRVTQGLTGDPNVTWCFLPRRALVYHSSTTTTTPDKLPTTSIYKIERGFAMQRLDAMEPVVVRLASFASNTSGVAILPNVPQIPTSDDLNRCSVHKYDVFQDLCSTGVNQEKSTNSLYKSALSQVVCNNSITTEQEERDNGSTVNPDALNCSYGNINNCCDDIAAISKDELAREILDLASETQGLFYYVNSPAYASAISKNTASKIDVTLWTVTQEERECFSRLACLEAMKSIDFIDETLLKRPLYSYWKRMMFRFVASVGVCLLWFGGSWIDIGIAGLLGSIVGVIAESTILSKQEKIIIEAVACYVVGLSAGIIALQFPTHTCFTAIAISAVVDLLQGFRLVFAIVEIMSRNTVAGGADFFESILYTGLIAYFLRFGQYTAGKILASRVVAPTPIGDEWKVCTQGVSWLWYPLFVPLTALSWSAMFSPNYNSLVPMTMHGVLAYSVNTMLSWAGINTQLNNFISALCVTFTAGIVSRFTGRQAVGNTVAGLYALSPGAYLVQLMYNDTIDTTFFTHILTIAISIAVGAWTGSLLCSPTLLGTTRGLMNQQSNAQHLQDSQPTDDTNQSTSTTTGSTSNSLRHRNRPRNNVKAQHTMLYF
jgi:uncharacterized membrane protein YjjP (DUF1212 family)